MWSFWTILLISLGVSGLPDEYIKKVQKDPLNAFLTSPFDKPRYTLNIHTNDSLPHDVVVHSYDILLEPFFKFPGFSFNKDLLYTFKGSASIVFSVLKPTFQIELASAVKISEYSLTSGRQRISLSKLNITGENHLTLHTTQKLYPLKNYTLHFRYSNEMSQASRGSVYYYEYNDRGNVATSLVASIFETIHAREAFPCFDDPSLKATFKLSLIHPKNAKVYSNAEIGEQHYFDEQRSLTRFKPTAKMSTYLLAFAIGDFVESHATSASGVKIRAMAVNKYRGLTNEAAVIGAHCVDTMENLVRVNYPLSKLDHLDTVEFSAGGMENFGFIIYGDIVPSSFGQTIAESYGQKSVICHETAHQWFGDLVTAQKWGWEFLHESFANYFEAHTVGQLDKYRYFVEISRVPVMMEMVEQFSAGSHPVADNTSHFDSITYDIGGAILNSIRNVLGDRTFYKGLNIYQRENAYANANLDVLLHSFEKAMDTKYLCGNLTFTGYAKDYFLQIGAPIVNVELDDNNVHVITQTPFRKKNLWNVPIFVQDLDTAKERLIWLLKDGSICSPLSTEANAKYFFNNNGKGFAKFNINQTILEAVYKHEKFTGLTKENHEFVVATVTNDLENPELANELIYKILKANGKVSPNLLRHLWTHSKYYNKTLELISNKFDYKNTPENLILGEYFLERAVRAGIESTVDKANQLFEKFTSECKEGSDVVECTE
ncbi:unnamed protein product [Bursaphelenchus xylophilus]|nr:unnamed protein product [Bursaphelenchus xylophilus]CAG9082148.1 unnamed protein product [Bursaphelenchus xylophilus]